MKTILRKQRVRILATGELGTVAEKVFIKRQGGQRPELYCRIWLDKKPKEDRWYFASELGETKEYAHATFAAGNQEVTVQITLDHEKNRMQFNVTGTLENPQRVAPVCQTPLTLRKKSAYAPYKSWPTGSFLFWLIGFSRL